MKLQPDSLAPPAQASVSCSLVNSLNLIMMIGRAQSALALAVPSSACCVLLGSIPSRCPSRSKIATSHEDRLKIDFSRGQVENRDFSRGQVKNRDFSRGQLRNETGSVAQMPQPQAGVDRPRCEQAGWALHCVTVTRVCHDGRISSRAPCLLCVRRTRSPGHTGEHTVFGATLRANSAAGACCAAVLLSCCEVCCPSRYFSQENAVRDFLRIRPGSKILEDKFEKSKKNRENRNFGENSKMKRRVTHLAIVKIDLLQRSCSLPPRSRASHGESAGTSPMKLTKAFRVSAFSAADDGRSSSSAAVT